MKTRHVLSAAMTEDLRGRGSLASITNALSEEQMFRGLWILSLEVVLKNTLQAFGVN